MAEETKKWIGEFESVLDHDITPEDFEKLTSFKWSERFDYLHYIVTSEFAGCYDIAELYSNFPNINGEKPFSHERNESLAAKYAELAKKAPQFMDYCR